MNIKEQLLQLAADGNKAFAQSYIFTHNRAIQKVGESYRVSGEE